MKHGYRKHQMERWSVGALERWSVGALERAIDNPA